MLEPPAPGTEGEFQMPQVSKKETEQERLLSQKAYLSNGKYGSVFELTFVNGAEHWYCNVCQCPVMGRAYHHEIGKRHTNNLSQWKNKSQPVQKPEPEPKETVQLEIAPGEPVPPGFEDEVERSAQIQERLNGYSVGPLVGLEYVIELQDSDVTKEPYYLCILCDKKGDPRTVLTHLASYNHISQYLQRHFRSAYRALAPYMTKQYKRNWQTCLQKIAEAIERRFGRLRPLPVDADKFEENRMFFLTKIAEGKHFQESPNNTFEELVVKEEMTKTVEDEAATRALELSRQEAARKEVALVEEKLPFRKNVSQQQPKKDPSPPVVQCPKKKKKPKKKQSTSNSSYVSPRRKSLSPVSSISSSDLSDHETRSRNRLYRSRSRSPPSGRPYRRSPSPRKRDYRKDSPLPWQRSSYGRQRNASVEKSQPKKSEKDEKMEEYTKLAKAIENDMERIWKQHEKNPEKHPHYNEEWKKFWNKRYKEIQAEGKDASKHDFKPEWIVYWNKRMKELHDEEVKNRKEALKNRLGVTEEPTPIKFRIQTKDRPKDNPVERKPIPPAACPDSDPEVIVIDDREDTRSSRFSSRRSRSPWEKEPPSKHRKMEKTSSREPSYRRSEERSVEKTADRRYQKRSMDRSSQRKSMERRSVDRRSVDRKSVDRKSIDRRSIDRRSIDRRSRERSSERKSTRKSPDRRSLDRLSLDRISSSASSSDEALTRPARDEYIDYHRSHSRERFISLDRPSPGVKYVRERDYHILHPYYGEIRPPKVLREATRQPVIVPVDDDDNEDINIVAVLRLLTALEEKLGSLGPKVNDLLAQALAMEKNEANSSETLLDSDINCVLFETVKEKLKGQLLAGLVDYIQEKAFKKAIKKTASLIHLAGVRKQEKASKNPVKVPGVGNVDKAAIARQIATALVLQGKTDVTQEELEQLINAVVGMAEASQKTNKPMTTAHFVEQLSGALSQKKPEVKPVEKPKEELTEIRKQQQPESPIEEPVRTNEEEKTPIQKMTDQSEKSSSMDHLSDSDLQTLLQNFKDLSTEEQHGLINYLKKLEAKEPERVEKLRKFVNLGSANSEKSLAAAATTTEGEQSEIQEKEEKPLGSPFSKRLGGTNPDAEEENEDENVITIEEGDEEEKKFLQKKDAKDTLDSDEEDYNFEDVVKAVSKNVEEKEQEKQRLLEEEKKKLDNEKMMDAQKLISNLISTFSKPTVEQPPVSAAEFTKTLSGLSVNMDNLANIVGNVKTLEANQRQLNQESIAKIDAEGNTNSNSSASLQVPRLNPPDIPMDVSFPGFFEHSNGSRPDFNAPNPSFERAAPRMERPGFDGPVPGYDRPGPGFDRPGPGFDRTGQDFERPGPGFDTRRPNFDRPGPGFDRPGPGFDRPRPGLDRPGPGLDRPVPGLDRSGPGLDRSGPSLDRPGPGFDRPGPGFDRSGPGFDRPGPGFDRPGPGFDRPGPGFDKTEYDRQGSGFNRPPFVDRQGSSRPGFDRPDFEFDRQEPYDRQGFDRQKRPAYDRPGQPDFDRGGPGSSFDRLEPGEIERMGPEGIDRRGAGFDRDGLGMNQRYDRFDLEKERQAGADDFDIPGLESLERRERDRPLSDRLAPAMSRLNSGIARGPGGDRSMGADRPGPGMDRVGPRSGPPDRFMDRPGRDVDRMNPPHERGFRGDNEPFIPSVNDRGNTQYGGKMGAPNFRGKNPSYPPNSRPVGPSGDVNFDDRFDDGFGKKQPFNSRRGGFNRW